MTAHAANARNHYASRCTLPAALARDLGRPDCVPYTRDEERAAFACLAAARAACWAAIEGERPEADPDDAAMLRRLASAPKAPKRTAALAVYKAAVAVIERHNLRLVVSVAQRYMSHPGAQSFDLADLVAYGCAGLHTAVLRFDPERGYTFGTYAPYWIGHAVGRAVQDLGRTIRIPIHAQDAMRKVRAADARLAAGSYLPPSDEMVAAETGLSVEVVRNARRYLYSVARTPASTTEPFGRSQEDEHGATLGDMLPDLKTPAPDEAVADAAIYRPETLVALLAELRPIEVEVITRRAGLGAHEPAGDAEDAPTGVRRAIKSDAFVGGGATLKEVGAELRLCRERVRQIQEAALAKMRKSAQRRGWAARSEATA